MSQPDSNSSGIDEATELLSGVPQDRILGFVSDIHGNYVALKEVLSAFESVGVGAKRIHNLGDVFGYGNRVPEVIDHALTWGINILGNHDFMVFAAHKDCLHEITSIPKAKFKEEPVLFVTVEQAGLINQRDIFGYLDGLRTSVELTPYILLIHDSPRSYNLRLIPQDRLYDEASIQEAFHIMDREGFRITFHGHNHKVGALVCSHLNSENETLERITFQRLNIDPECHYIVDVGSVGQPRDGDRRACATVGVLNEKGMVDSLICIRVPYDIEEAAQGIREAGYPPAFADRLLEGF